MKKNRSLIVIFTLLMQTLLIITVNNTIITSPNITPLKAFIPWINLIIVVLAILNILSIWQIKKETERKTTIKLLKKQLEEVESLNNILRSQQHDYSNHIQVIQSMAHLDYIDDLKEYINGIAKGYQRTKKMIYTENPVITSLINTKRNTAESQGIDFAVAVKCNLSAIDIPPWDLNSILGNLLDNAIEAAIYATNPKLTVEFLSNNNFYYIYIKNNGATIPDKTKIFEPGFSTKNSLSRGYGLYLVKNLLNQYNGEIEIETNKITTILVKLPKKEANNDKCSLS